MRNTTILTLVLLTLFAGMHDLHAQKGTFALDDTFTTAEIPINTKVYLVPGKKNMVVVYGIDIHTLDIQVIDNVLRISSKKKIHTGHILIYYNYKRSVNYPAEPETIIQKIIKA